MQLMADSRKQIGTHPLDLDEILREAEHRWLRPAEICEILHNYKKFELTPDPPVRPPAGSLFLFDRKALRYFRKDGHRWRKKKDGKTVREAHEKLKAGSVDVLHCYYAHSEDNDNFQRRSYWLLDEKLEHIVLVHYREVKEGYKSGVSRLPVNPVSLAGSPQNNAAPSYVQVNSPTSVVQTSYQSSANRVDWNGQALSSDYEDVDSGIGQLSSHAQSINNSITHSAPLLTREATRFSQLSRNPFISWSSSLPSFYPGTGSSLCELIQNTSGNTTNVHDGDLYIERSIGGIEADLIVHKLNDARLGHGSTTPDVLTCRDRLLVDVCIQPDTGVSHTINQVQKEHDCNSVHTQSHEHTYHPAAATCTVSAEPNVTENGESAELRKLDSFGRWMDKELGRDCDDSLMASDSGCYWNTLDDHNEDKEVSSLRHLQLDMDSLGPSLSQEQLFSIHDFSPDWAYAGVETKVLIVGTFLGSKKLNSETKWGCMFGENEVLAEVLTDNVIRCRTPLHSPGRVPFYVTCSNRLACSEVREFEYRENPTKFIGPMGIGIAPADEVVLQMRLLKLVDLGTNKKLDCSIPDCEKCKIKGIIYSMRDDSGIYQEISKIVESDHLNPKDVLFQRLVRDKLYEWLVSKIHEEGKGPHVLDDKGQGVIHLAAALGYSWAMGPLVAAGVSPNFRDAHGRTGLHWASYFGREETVIALVKLGAAAGAVEDPTTAFPHGQTAADLASSRGHKGIAGYLAEVDLSSHLSTLNVNENDIDNISATIVAKNAFETAQADSSNMTMDEHHSLTESLAAFRKSAHTAALIQAAFRVRSFRQRQLTRGSSYTSEAALDLVMAGSLNKVQKMAHYEDYLHSAALRIQRRYRGWKGRKEFLTIRTRIVKIQAHVRGHRVRKQYKKVVWSVSIVEKAILRWRRKGAGLRGFRVGRAAGIVAPDNEKTDEYDFLSIGRRQKSDSVDKALARVKSMVRHPEAWDQYKRLVMKFQNFKVGEDGTS